MSATIPRARLPQSSEYLTGPITQTTQRARLADAWYRWVRGIDQCCRAASSTQAGLVQGDGSTVVINEGVISFSGTTGTLILTPVAEPASPASGFQIYCDAADGNLKFKSDQGNVGVLGLRTAP